MKKTLASLAAAIAVGILAAAPAAEAAELTAGTAEIGVAMPYSAPMIGYFVKDNIEVAGSFFYLNGEMKSGGVGVDVSVMVFNLAGRYYFSPLNFHGLVPFAGAGYQRLSLDPDQGDETTFSRLFFGGGVKYFLTDNVAVEGSVAYNTGSIDDGSGSELDVSGFQLGAGLTIFVR